MRAAPGAAAALLLWALLVPAGTPRAQGKDEIRLEDIEKEIAQKVERPYSLGGFFEFQPTLFGFDRDAAFYRLRFLDEDEGATAAQYDGRLRLEGSYRKDIFSLFVRADADHPGRPRQRVPHRPARGVRVAEASPRAGAGRGEEGRQVGQGLRVEPGGLHRPPEEP